MQAAPGITTIYGFALLSLATTGCTTVTPHGDANLYDIPRFPLSLEAVDPLEFPKSSLAQPATFAYRVLNLPQEVYPHGFLLEIPEAEDSRWLHNQPWRKCVLRASLLTANGEVFFTKRFDFSKDWNGGSEAGSDSDHRKISFAFTDYNFTNCTSSLPKHLSYILRLEVLSPSLRSTDQIETDAPTLLHHPK